MNKLLLLAFCVLLITACKNTTADKSSPIGIFSITDNDKTYRDTIMTLNSSSYADSIKSMLAQTKDTAQASALKSLLLQSEGVIPKKDTSAQWYYSCAIHKTTNGSFFTMSYNIPSTIPISMAIISAEGPIKGTGIFKAKSIENKKDATDTAKLKFAGLAARNSFSENFAGGEKYSVDSALVTITKAEKNTIQGNYQLWLTNASGSKMVTGTINCNTATID